MSEIIRCGTFFVQKIPWRRRIITYQYKKAELEEISQRFYTLFVCKALSKIKVCSQDQLDIPRRDEILIYCFLHKAISREQLYLLYTNSLADKNAVNMMLQRMMQKMLVRRIHYNNSKGIAYIITAQGINESKNIIKKYTGKSIAYPDLIVGNYKYTLDDILNNLAEKCLNSKPAHWSHYFLTRNLYLFLITNNAGNKKIIMDVEVPIDCNGRVVSVYNRSVQGTNMQYELRADAKIDYWIQQDFLMTLFIEVDTGTQRSAVLTQKVNKYVNLLMANNEITTTTALLFYIDTTMAAGSCVKKSRKSSSKDYQYVIALKCINDMYKYFDSEQRSMTVGQAKVLINDIGKAVNHSNEFRGLYDYINKRNDTFNSDCYVDDLQNNYTADMKNTEGLKEKKKEELYYKKYLNRRSLLQRSVIDVPGLQNAFLKGYSLYTLSSCRMEYIYHLYPEMFLSRIHIMSALRDIKIINQNDRYKYQPLLVYEDNKNVLKNCYLIENSDVKVVIENISDDLGGFTRVINILKRDEVPKSLINTKIICLIDEKMLCNIKNSYLDTKQGIKLACVATDKISIGFEILFIAYDMIPKSMGIFTFNLSGETIYKTRYPYSTI